MITTMQRLVQLTLLLCGVHIQPALAGGVDGLFSTGVDDQGIELPLGSIDQHYSVSGPIAIGQVISPFPSWATPPAGSAWIGPAPSNQSSPEGAYTYQTIVHVSVPFPANVVIHGQWTTDNLGSILLNGVSTGQDLVDSTAFNALHEFAVTGLIQGDNILEFVVTNAFSGGSNPTGLLIAGVTVDLGDQTGSRSLDNGCAGSDGVPVLSIVGTFMAASATQVSLTGVIPNSLSVLMIGFEPASLVREGCTLLFQPVTFMQAWSDATGEVDSLLHWPPGVASEQLIFVQAYVVDAGAPTGFASSNTVKITAP